MAVGRPAKPTALKRLSGNPGHRALNEAEPRFTPHSGYCPRWLSDEAKEVWRRLAPELIACGLLTVVDGMALEALCESYAQWRRALMDMRVNGTTSVSRKESHGEYEQQHLPTMIHETTFVSDKGYLQQRPEVSIANNAVKQLRAFMAEFGMTPSSRTRVTMATPEGQDPFSEYLAETWPTERKVADEINE